MADPSTADGNCGLVSVRGVWKHYGDTVVTPALREIDLCLERAEFAALVGPSGSGKSTLLHLLGLLDRPSEGVIEILGRPTAELDDAVLTRLRGRALGFVFQFHHLLPGFTAAENVMMPMLAQEGRASAAMRARAEALLEEVGLEGLEERRATDLSGGQQQRVAIARALAMSPSLVLADEPTGNLDTETGNQVFRLLRSFNERHGTAFLIVTHDPRIARRCDRVVHLVDGRIVSDMKVREASLPPEIQALDSDAG